MHNHATPSHRAVSHVGVVAIIAVQLAAAGAAFASSAGAGIVVGRGIDGVQLLQSKPQVRTRLGAFPCNCGTATWSYVAHAGDNSPVAGVAFTHTGLVNEVFAFGSRTKNHLLTARGVGLGSTLANVQRAYESARCDRIAEAKATGGPPSGRCAIVTRLRNDDADTVFIASDGDHSLPGSIYDVAVDVLSAASTETISLSVSPKPARNGRRAWATVSVVVTSTSFYDFPSGLRIAGDRVTLTSTSRAVRLGRVSDHQNGTYTATIMSARDASGIVTLTASDGAVSQRVKLSLARL